MSFSVNNAKHWHKGHTMYFLFSDIETFHKEIKATSWREALAIVRTTEGLRGRLRCASKGHFFEITEREYTLDNTLYSFSLRLVP